MQHIIQIGPLAVRGNVLLTAVSLVAAYIMLYYRLRKTVRTRHSDAQEETEQPEQTHRQHEKQNERNDGGILDGLSNALLITVLAWKLSIFLFEPGLSFKHPLSVLYFDGGMRGIWLGIGIALAYLSYLSQKRSFSFAQYADLLMVGWTAGSILYEVIHLVIDPSRWTTHLLLIVFNVVFAAIIYRMPFAKSDRLIPVILWYTLGNLLFTFIGVPASPIVLGFSATQIAYIIITLTVFILTIQNQSGSRAGR